MSEWTCPICGQKECEYHPQEDVFDHYHCKKFDFYFFLSREIKHMPESERKDKILNLIAEHMLHNKFCVTRGENRQWYFYDGTPGTPQGMAEYVNIGELLSNYPEQVMDKAYRSLVNLSLLYPHYGDIFTPMWTERRILFEHEINNVHRSGMARILEDLGYLKDPKNHENYSITAHGWQKIDELRKEEQIVHQGFIAMSFREDTRPIREAFRTAMQESGYSVAVIDEKEHNNQIVPEIFYEIERSKFVVVDVTYPNYGAYYEAGYAQALGKQVIICCREAEFHDKSTRPHFDISQKSMVVWKDESDLVQRLKRRIEATVK